MVNQLHSESHRIGLKMNKAKIKFDGCFRSQFCVLSFEFAICLKINKLLCSLICFVSVVPQSLRLFWLKLFGTPRNPSRWNTSMPTFLECERLVRRICSLSSHLARWLVYVICPGLQITGVIVRILEKNGYAHPTQKRCVNCMPH